MADVYVLGAGGPNPTAPRFGSAHVLSVAGELLMFDCGPAATHKLVKAGLFPTKVDHLFFTHHHFDHNIDYPCFLLCRWDQSIGEENRLQVFGPNLTEKITEGIIGENGVFADDWKARVNHPLSQQVFLNRGGTLPRKPPSVAAKDVGPGLVFSGKDWRVTAAPTEHVQPWLDSLAYRVDSSEVSVVFSGDTRPCESVTSLARNADVMVCMCTDDEAGSQRAHQGAGSCSTAGAARMARDAGVKKLILVHIGPHLAEHGPMESGIGEVRSIFDGEIVFSEEVMRIPL
jgi:ribonuclease BN (tRNA processing enzyme)